MKDRLKSAINNLQAKHNISVNYNIFEKNQHEEQYIAKYNKTTKSIDVNFNLLQLEWNAQYNDYEFEEYCEAIFCHELGHYFDDALPNDDDAIRAHTGILSAFRQGLYKPQTQEDKDEIIDIQRKLHEIKIEQEKRAYKIGKDYCNNSLEEVYDRKNTEAFEKAESDYADEIKKLCKEINNIIIFRR